MVSDRPTDPWFIRRNATLGTMIFSALVIVWSMISKAIGMPMPEGLPVVTVTSAFAAGTAALGVFTKFVNDDVRDKRNGHGA